MVKKEKYIEPMAKSWVEDATKLIKFKDDRLRVQAELLDHIEDAADAWKDAGYDDYEAKKKAVSNMGDAAEVANNLADIYRPFWGRLWKLTKIIRNLLIVWLIFLTIDRFNAIKYDFTFDYNEQFDYNHSEKVIFDNTPDDEVKVDGYTVKLKRVKRTEISHTLEADEELTILLEVTNINPLKRYIYLLGAFTAYDDLGNVYPPSDHYADRDLIPDEVFECLNTIRVSDILPNKTYHYLQMYPDPDATEITIVFDRFGHKFQVTTPIAGGADNE